MSHDVKKLTFFSSIVQTIVRGRRATRASLESYRDRALHRLVRHAANRVPFQRDRLRGIDPRNVDLEAIPPTDKQEMMDRFDETIADGVVRLNDVLRMDDDPHRIELPVVKGKYLASKTSGSSGAPSWIVQSLKDWSIVRGAVFARITQQWVTLRRLAISGIRPLRCATIAAEHSLTMTWQAVRSAQLSNGRCGFSHFCSVLTPMETIVRELNELRPEYIHAYPTAMEMLSRYKLGGGECRFEPNLISVGSEKLTPTARDAIRRAFPDSILVDHYGLTECLPLSTSCAHGNRHLNMDFGILEPVDRFSRRVPDGEFSDHILVTNLVNRVQPLIRYRVNDSVRFLPEPCLCGSPFPVLELFSRKGDLIYLKTHQGSWQLLSPPIVTDTILHVRGLAQYQVSHLTQNHLIVKCQAEAGTDRQTVTSEMRREFLRALEKLNCSRSVTLTVEAVDGFERTAVGGKLQQMISRVPEPDFELPKVA